MHKSITYQLLAFNNEVDSYFFLLATACKTHKIFPNLLKMSIYFYVHPSTHYFPKKQFCRKKVTNLELEIHRFIKQSKKNFLKMNCVALAKHPSRKQVPNMT